MMVQVFILLSYLELLFTPQTPKITGIHKSISATEKFSFKIIIPASTETTVIIFEKDEDLTALITEVE